MIQGFYSAASGLAAAQDHQDVLSQNLTNAAIPGYRRMGLAFSSFNQALAGPSASPVSGLSQGAQVSQSFTNFQAGDVFYTAQPLECALRGDGFFVLRGADGPLYTRNGSFQIASNGQLTSSGGMPVEGTGGPINIPPNTQSINIGVDGTVAADGAAVGQLRVVSFADPNTLTRVGPTLFQPPAGTRPQPSTAVVNQGYREGSNVQVVQEMVNMILGMRHYDAATKAIHSISDAVGQQTRAA